VSAIGALVLLFHASSVHAQSAEADLQAAEARLAAALAAKDAAVFEQLLAPGFVLRASPDVSRETWMKNALAMCWGDRVDVSDLTVRSLSAETAVVSLVLTTHQDPETCAPAVVRSLLTDVWTRTAGDPQWRLSLRHSGPAGSTLADQSTKTPPPPPRWERTGELSLVATSGNTDTQTLGAAASVVWRPGVWNTQARTAYIRSVADDVLTAESFAAMLRQARTLTPRLEAFVRGEYLVDRFAGIESRTTVDGGLAWQAIDSAVHSLKLDAGAGVTNEVRLDAEDQTFAVGSAGALYAWKVSATTTVTDQALLTTDLGDIGNWRLHNNTAVTTTVTRVLLLKLAYDVKRSNRPVPGFRATDTILSAALVAKF
jgi:putative salt-induced outer membrane protein